MKLSNYLFKLAKDLISQVDFFLARIHTLVSQLEQIHQAESFKDSEDEKELALTISVLYDAFGKVEKKEPDPQIANAALQQVLKKCHKLVNNKKNHPKIVKIVENFLNEYKDFKL